MLAPGLLEGRKLKSSPIINNQQTHTFQPVPKSEPNISQPATMIRQTPRLVNLASRSVAATARNADSKQQLALRAFADSASSTEAKRTVSSPFAKEDIDPLDVFAAIDTNNDGVLQKDEFLRAVDMLNYDEVRAVSHRVMLSCVLHLAAILQLAQVSTSPMG